MALSDDSKSRIEAVLKLANDDVSFRESLLDNPDDVLRQQGLNDDEIALIRDFRRVALEEAGIDIRESRMVLRDNGAKIEI